MDHGCDVCDGGIYSTSYCDFGASYYCIFKFHLIIIYTGEWDSIIV